MLVRHTRGRSRGIATRYGVVLTDIGIKASDRPGHRPFTCIGLPYLTTLRPYLNTGTMHVVVYGLCLAIVLLTPPCIPSRKDGINKTGVSPVRFSLPRTV